MRVRGNAVAVLCAVVSAFGCSAKLVPKPYPIPAGAVHALEASGLVAVRVVLTGNPEHEVTVPWTKVTVSDDEFAAAVVSRLIGQLREKGVAIDDAAPRRIQLGVERVSVQQATMGSTLCTVECALKLGDGEPLWLRGRRGSRSYEKACAAAASQAVIEILNHAVVRKYLEE